MANQYDTNLKLQAIADAIGDSQSSGLISALEDIASAIGGGGGSGAGLVSDAFDDTRTYAIGDYCIHNNTLYRCTTAIQTPGAWNINDWQATNAGTELSTLNSKLNNYVKRAQISISSIGAGVGKTGSTSIPDNDGMTPIYVTPVGTNHSDCVITECSMNVGAGTISMSVFNLYSSAQNANAYALVFYK